MSSRSSADSTSPPSRFATEASSSTTSTPAPLRACRAGPRCSPGNSPCRVSQTDGIAKRWTDPAMGWLDPDQVPTLGDWFRAGGYQTHYRGKWHITHADLPIPGAHESLMASDDDGTAIADAVAAYRKADRLGPLGFSVGSAATLTASLPVGLRDGPRRRLRRASGRACSASWPSLVTRGRGWQSHHSSIPTTSRCGWSLRAAPPVRSARQHRA